MSTWSGAWVAERLGVRLEDTGGPGAPDLRDLVGLAVRDNPRRAQLLVSTVLGKHIPTDPRVVHTAGLQLGRLVGEVLGEGAVGAEHVLVLGYAETATALGHLVADALGAAYLHSTRRAVPGVPAAAGFAEAHSHATSHLLLPEDPALLTRPDVVVLVDDELSTGSTALGTIRAVQALAPRDRFVIAALVDLRSPDDQDRLQALAEELGTTIEVVALARGEVHLPADAADRGRRLVARHRLQERDDSTSTAPVGSVRRVDLGWPVGVREGGRHGFGAADRVKLERVLPSAAAQLAAQLAAQVGPGRPGGGVHVLGFEEFMYTPLRVALGLAELLPDRQISFSATTRSPVLVVDEPGYAIRAGVHFCAADNPSDGPGPRHAYNLRRCDTVVLVIDDPADTPALVQHGGLVEALRRVAEEVLVVVVPVSRPSARPLPPPLPHPLPRPLSGPEFGSYRAEDVDWLLTDLSAVDLEAPTEEREEAIQSGGAHYAESLPVEYQPDAAYQALFTAALQDSAVRVAFAVGLVTEQLLAQQGDRVVLASLARAGTPVGILMRRWAELTAGLELSHYAVSIVRGRGIDEVALRYLAAHHDPADIAFVDGWTGKGAITRELAASVAGANRAWGTAFSAELAVLADPGRCVRTFGTREDYLIPSAALNSTVSGLVSRTVLNRQLIGPGQFHGAKYYRELAGADVSQVFLDAVVGRFHEVRSAVAEALPAHLASDRTPTWAGWAAVEAISRDHGIGDVNLVKPGVGETTRVLLRRVPWKVLARADATAELGHVRLLAKQRGVEVVEVGELPYSCVGLIHPRYTRGAVGVDGRGAAR